MPSLKFRIDGEVRDVMIPAASTWTALQNSLRKSFPLSGGLSDITSIKLVNAAGEVVVGGIEDAKSFWHAVSSSYKATCCFTIERSGNAYASSGGANPGGSYGTETPANKMINFSYGNEVKEITIPSDAKWRDLVSAVKREFDITSSISHFVLVDESGDDFSAEVDTPEKFWKLAARYGSAMMTRKSDFSFRVYTNGARETHPAANFKVTPPVAPSPERSAASQRTFQVHLERLGSAHPEESATIKVPSQCSWEHIIEAIENVLRLDSGSVLYLVPMGSLSGPKKVTSKSIFWKVVSEADLKGSTIKWAVRLGTLRLGSFDAADAPNRFRSRSIDSLHGDAQGEEESVSVALSESPEDVRGVLLKRNCGWRDITSAIVRAFNLPKSQPISHLLAIDPIHSITREISAAEELWELSPNVLADCNVTAFLGSAQQRSITNRLTKPQSPEQVSRITASVRSSPHERTPAVSEVTQSLNAASLRATAEAQKIVLKATLVDGSNDSSDLVFYDVPAWEDFADRLGFLFKVVGRGVDFVIFIDNEGDEVSGPVNSDAKLKRVLEHPEHTHAFKVFLTKNALLSRRVNIKTALASNPERFIEVCLPRLPKWAEARKEVARTFNLTVDSISHFIYLHRSGEEASGNLNSDIKIAAFFEQFDANQFHDLTLSVFLHSRTKNSEAKMSTLLNFYASCLENRTKELDAYASQVDVDAINPDTCTSAFLECCKQGKLESVKWLVKNGADINQKLDDGCTGLHLAIMHNRNDVVSFLVTSGASIVEPNKREMNPFMTACHFGNHFAVELLHRRGARINEVQATHGGQPIHLAAYGGFVDIVQWLFETSGISNIDFVYHPHNKTLMMYAAEGGSVAVMEWLLAKGLKVTDKGSVPGQEGFTPLHYAALAGRLEATRWLLKQGVPLHEKCVNGSTALSLAMKLNQAKVTNAILDFVLQGKKTLDVDVISKMLANCEFDRARSYLESFFRAIKFETSPVDAPTCMCIAASCSHFVILEYLFLCGFDVDSVGIGGTTPLMAAVTNSQFDMVKFLIRRGANINALNYSGDSALSLSLLTESKPIQSYIRDVYDYVNILQRRNQFSIFSCVSGPEEISAELSERISAEEIGMLNPGIKQQFTAAKYPLEIMCKYPLNCCIKLGASMDLITLLVEAEQDLEAVDDEGLTPLYNAVLSRSEPVIDLLLTHGAKVTQFSEAKHATPLHHISSLGLHNSLAKIIEVSKLKSTGSINWDQYKDASGGTAVHAAVLGNCIEAVALLVEKAEMSINNPGPCDRSPLILSCIYQFDDITNYLLDRGADVNMVDCFGRTAIFYAMKQNNLPLVQYLVRMGASLQQKSLDGVTIMFLACENNNLEAMKWLYSKRASVTERTGDNLSLLDVAESYGYHEVSEWIKEAWKHC